MHRALQIDEILRNAFAKHAPDFKPEFYSLAMSCKTFLEPALDGLWYSITDINHLFRVFPDNAFQEPQLSDDYLAGGNVLNLIRPLLPGEWDRFDYYAKRIHDLRLEYFKYPPLFDDVKASLRVSPLFPNARFIQMTVWNSCYDDPILFVSPKTKDLLIDVYYGDWDDSQHHGDERQSQLVKAIAKSGATFESLRIPSLSKYYDLSIFTSQGAQSLQAITISEHIDWPAIECLATLPFLQRFHILEDCTEASDLLSDRAPPANPIITGHTIWFSAIRELSGEVGLVYPIISSFKSCDTLRDLSISGVSTSDAQRAIDLVGSTFRSIHRLTLSCDTDLSASTSSTLRMYPLLNCSDLKSLHMTSLGDIQSPSDEDYYALSRAWPKLEDIYIGTSDFPQATLSAIAALSRHCSRLETLHIDTLATETVPEDLEFGRLPRLRTLMGQEWREMKRGSLNRALWGKFRCEMAQPEL